MPYNETPMKGITMMNPVKKYKNLDGEGKLALFVGATYVGVAAAAVTAAAGTVAIAYGTKKVIDQVSDTDN